jgi:hypothetical protein
MQDAGDAARPGHVPGRRPVQDGIYVVAAELSAAQLVVQDWAFGVGEIPLVVLRREPLFQRLVVGREHPLAGRHLPQREQPRHRRGEVLGVPQRLRGREVLMLILQDPGQHGLRGHRIVMRLADQVRIRAPRARGLVALRLAGDHVQGVALAAPRRRDVGLRPIHAGRDQAVAGVDGQALGDVHVPGVREFGVLARRTPANPGELRPADLLIRGFGVQVVPGSAPVTWHFTLTARPVVAWGCSFGCSWARCSLSVAQVLHLEATPSDIGRWPVHGFVVTYPGGAALVDTGVGGPPALIRDPGGGQHHRRWRPGPASA